MRVKLDPECFILPATHLESLLKFSFHKVRKVLLSTWT